MNELNPALLEKIILRIVNDENLDSDEKTETIIDFLKQFLKTSNNYKWWLNEN